METPLLTEIMIGLKNDLSATIALLELVAIQIIIMVFYL